VHLLHDHIIRELGRNLVPQTLLLCFRYFSHKNLLSQLGRGDYLNLLFDVHVVVLELPYTKYKKDAVSTLGSYLTSRWRSLDVALPDGLYVRELDATVATDQW
jgi:hypothetical protein